MKVVQLNEWTPKKGSKMSNTTPKLSQNQMSKLKETKKTKVVKLYEQTPKQFKPDTKKQKNYPQLDKITLN